MLCIGTKSEALRAKEGHCEALARLWRGRPPACTSEIVVSANFREWRHILTVRTDKGAQWEIRKAANLILGILKEHAPACFEDIVPEN
jgi:thymidylate synthase ThyX